jgi:hypothetical protein
MSDATPPQAGWYRDPENPVGERWWNGSGWSDQKRAASSRPDPYAPASPYVAAPYGAPAYGSRSNGLAVAGLIVSAGGWIVLGVLASIAGIILSAFGLARAKQAEAAGNPNSGRGIAMAGLIIGIVVTVLGIAFFVLYFAFVLSVGPTF